MDRRLIRMLHTLRSGRDALRSEMELWALQGALIDVPRLQHLQSVARDFVGQAFSLLVIMAYANPPEALQQEIDGLMGIFGKVATTIEALLVRSQDPD